MYFDFDHNIFLDLKCLDTLYWSTQRVGKAQDFLLIVIILIF